MALIEQNIKHFRKVMNIKAHKDKIYYKLKENKAQDRILEGILRRDECYSKDVYQFLLLLQCQNELVINKEHKPILMQEWAEVVKKTKRMSTLSIFLKQNYAMCKLLLQSDEIIEILVKYYYTIIQQNFYPSRYVLDAILNKGKDLVIGKLQTIQLTEADF